MLSKEMIEKNKKEFLNLVNSINREFDKEKLISWLNKSDFFTAPASTKYHCAYEGGLCAHSLNVYNGLKYLAYSYLPQLPLTEKEKEEGVKSKIKYDEDTLKIVGLFHDISKANIYEKYKRNMKDANGNWIQVEEYKTKDDRFIFGSDEQTAEFMLSTFIPLTVEEKVAILHKSGGKAFDSTQTSIPLIFQNYDLAALLNCADILSCYVLEKYE